MLPLTCILPVYRGVTPAEFTRAFRSVVHQTQPADEVLVVADGPLQAGVDDFLDRQSGPHLTVIRFETNQGVAAAMRAGFDAARHRWVARHDADDIMTPDRFEKQWPVVSTGRYAAVGAAVYEFVDTPTNVVRVRRLPTEPDDIARYARINSPMNNPSVIFDRDAVLSVGSVRDVPFLEDYDLFARLIARGYLLRSLDEPLVLMHAQESMFDRRTDPRLAAAEKDMQRTLVELGLVSRPRSMANYAARQAFRALPRPLLKRAYSVLFDRSGDLDEPSARVRRWEDEGWPGLTADPGVA